MPQELSAAYQLDDPSNLLTPCLLVYPDIIRQNVAEAIRIAGSPARLRPHVKTHKTAEIVRMVIDAGIAKHKCATLAEALLLAECQATDVLIAYPVVGPSIARLAEMIEKYPLTRFSGVVDNPRNVAELQDQFAKRNLQLEVLIDVDSGMHRTGIEPGDEAAALARQIAESANLKFVGLHVYDGQNHQSSLEARRDAVQELMKPVFGLVEKLMQSGIAVPTLVCGGTPTFPVFAETTSPIEEVAIELSPGTCVLSDYNYGNSYRDMSGIQHALLLLTRVISKTGDNRLTLDLGYKAVAADQPADRRCFFPELPDAKLIQHSEEHLVIQTPEAEHIEVGRVLYAVPGHVCPTVALHAHMHVVQAGKVCERWRVAARDRLI